MLNYGGVQWVKASSYELGVASVEDRYIPQGSISMILVLVDFSSPRRAVSAIPMKWSSSGFAWMPYVISTIIDAVMLGRARQRVPQNQHKPGRLTSEYDERSALENPITWSTVNESSPSHVRETAERLLCGRKDRIRGETSSIDGHR